MRRVKASIVFACLMFLGAPAATHASPDEDPAASEADHIVALYYKDFYARKYAEALSAVSSLKPDSSNPVGQAIVNAMRAGALMGMKRDSEAQSLAASVDTLSPIDPTARETLFETALDTDHFDIAADSIDALIDRAPDAARDLDWNLVVYLLSHEPKGQDRRNEDRRIALARIGYGGDSQIGHGRALNAVQILYGRGDLQGASDFLKDVKDPEAFENMLIQKRYSALWPKLEELGGEHLALVRAAELASAEKAFEAAPDDMQKLQEYVDALRHVGRSDDAIALRAKLPVTTQAMAAVDEKTGWAVNELAYAYNEAGRVDEGDQLFAMLNDPPRTDSGWRVSMFINRLEMLTWAGKFQKAATLLDATDLTAKNDGNEYAQQLVRRLRYCILSSLGRKDEAAKLLPEVLKHAGDALEPTVEGLICAGNSDEAEKLALQGLQEPDRSKREHFEEQFVRALQPVPLTSDDPSVWEKSWSSLRNRPAIAAAFDKLGRDLPSNLLAESRKKASLNNNSVHLLFH